MTSLRRWSCVLVVALWSAPHHLAAQTGSIAGRIIDADTGRPVAAAEVVIADAGVAVLTQQDGTYVFADVPGGIRTVAVRRVGYRGVSKTVDHAGDQTTAPDIRLQRDALGLDETLVSGTPRPTRRRAIGNSVSTMDVDEVVQAASVLNSQDLFSGRVPGLRFTRLTGNIGTGSPMTMRGVSSFAFARTFPLVYVDGIRVNSDPNAGPIIGSGRSTHMLDDFNPQDFERVEVLKGPAATSLYGTDASAGVVHILTKRGGEGAPEFNVSIRQGMNFLSDPAGRLGTLYYCPTQPSPSATIGVACTSRDQLETYNMYDEANNYLALGYGASGWQTPRLYSSGPSDSYNLDVRGGTQALRYFLSANYDDETGYVFYNTDQTFRLRGNVGVDFSEHFSVDVTTGYADGSTTYGSATVSDGAEWQDMVWSNGYHLDRNARFGTTGNCPTGTGQSNCAPNPRIGGFQEHLPSDIAEDVEVTRDYQRFTGSFALGFTSGDRNVGGMTASLTQRAVVGVDRGWDINRNRFLRESGIVPTGLIDYCRAGGRPSTCAPPSWNSVYTETAQGEMTYERPTHSHLTVDYALTAGLRPNAAWRFDTSFGAQYVRRVQEDFSNTGQGFTSFTSETINQISQANILTSFSRVETKSLGVYVQQELSFADRIFLSGAVRVDDHSNFGVEAPTQTYPKVGAAWVLSEEDFWPLDIVDAFRVRGAWGKAGRAPGNLSEQSLFVPAAGLGGVPGLRPSTLGNPSIEAEVSTEIEWGFDIALLEDRLAGTFTSHRRKNENLILDVVVPSSLGLTGTMDQNVGRIDAWGWEAQVSARLWESDRISVDIDFGADYTNNGIKDLCGPGVQGVEVCHAGTPNIRIGYPYPNQTVADFVVEAGFDQTLPTCTAAMFSAGTRCRFGQNSFGQALYAYCALGLSRAPGGNSDPNAAMYGLFPGGAREQCGAPGAADRNLYAGRGFATQAYSVAPRLTFLGGDLQVFALAEGQYGRTSHDSNHLWGHNYRNSAVGRVQDDAWWVATDLAVSTGCAWDKCLFDASFWKLREFGARVALPTAWVERTGAERASLSFSARNLLKIWQAQKRISGHVITDPEDGNPTNLNGGNNFYEGPPLTSVSLTLRVTF